MLQTLVPGAKLDIVSRNEVKQLLEEYARQSPPQDRVRAAESVTLDATGAAKVDVYKVPAGMRFEARRVVIDMGDASDVARNSVNLSAAGVSAQYLRSGTRIEWALPVSQEGGFRVPGVETWGAQQGPSLVNGEVFQVQVLLGGGKAGVTMTVLVEGVLTKGGLRT